MLISNEDTDVVMNIIEPLEKSGLLIDDAIEAVKYEIKKGTRKWISWFYYGTYG